MGITVLVLCSRAAGSAHQNALSPIFERGLGAFQNVMYVKGGRKYLKNPCLQNLHRDISFRTQCDKEGV